MAAATLLASAAAANTLAARRAEHKHPPRGKFVTVDGVRLHYLEAGSGPPVVLIHGNGVSSDDYTISGLFQALAQRHRVVAFDRPGFGYSERPRNRIWTASAQGDVLFKAMAELRIVNPVIVGHSWGSSVALNIGLDNPQSIAGLVLMSGYYSPTLRVDVPMAAGPAIPLLGDLVRFTLSPLLGWALAPLIFKQVFSPSKVTERFNADFPRGIALRPSQIRASAADALFMVPDAMSASPRLAELEPPLLVIAGRGDKIASFAHQSERLSKKLPNSQLLAVDGAGHMVHHVAKAAVVEAIEAFAKRLRSAPDAADARTRREVVPT